MVRSSLIYATAVCAAAHELHIHVDSRADLGGAAADGTASLPYPTLDGARSHIIHSSSNGAANAANAANATVVHVHPGRYASLRLDHAALSWSRWEGVIDGGGAGAGLPIVTGGVDVPIERFAPWPGRAGVVVASLAGLNVSGGLGGMQDNNCVDGCRHDKVGVTFDGAPLTLARWPNRDAALAGTDGGWEWAHAWVDPAQPTYNGFIVNTTDTPDAARMEAWAAELGEGGAWVHGYFEWDWADCYQRVTSVERMAPPLQNLIQLHYDGGDDPSTGVPKTKPYARWMGVNLLCELDAPGEYYIGDAATDHPKLYLFPPSPLVLPQQGRGRGGRGGSAGAGTVVTLAAQVGAVVTVGSAARNVTVSRMEVVDGRHAGVDATDTHGATLRGLVVHGHGEHGIVLEGATGGAVVDCRVYDVGCSGIRATGGAAASLRAGGLLVEGNDVRRAAQWKRTYMPGVFWSGVGNTYRGNTVAFAPHNGFLGGGNFGDGVGNTFEGNTLADCTFETIDTGAFYTCGQLGNAFTNRGNVLRGNTFLRARNTKGTGVQTASNQAVYFDDQMSGWLVVNNSFEDCEVGTFTGGGRRNVIVNNSYRNCGTVHYLNNQGMTFDSAAVQCDKPVAPAPQDCSTGAARWMATRSAAAGEYAARWPEMLNISQDDPGPPAHNLLAGNRYCGCGELISDNVSPQDAASWKFVIRDNVDTGDC
jgi:hypothetical protein